MDAALAALRSSDSLKTSDVARKYGVSGSALLSKPIHAKTSSRTRGHESQRMLNENVLGKRVGHVSGRVKTRTHHVVKVGRPSWVMPPWKTLQGSVLDNP